MARRPKRRTYWPTKVQHSESVFGHLDQIMKQKLSITTIASEACIMFTYNKTGEWLAAKQKRPTRSVKDVRKAFQQRQCDIQDAQRANILRRLAQAEGSSFRKKSNKHWT